MNVRDDTDDTSREVFVPLKPNGGVMNPNIRVHPPTPGVVVYRFEESYLYPNSSLVNDAIVDFVKVSGLCAYTTSFTDNIRYRNTRVAART